MCTTLPGGARDRDGDREGRPVVPRPRGHAPAAAALVDRRADEPVHLDLDGRARRRRAAGVPPRPARRRPDARLADEVGRDALRCIRCSACINVCPVYRQTGGHAYHTPYAGPIGAILQPQLDGERGASGVAPVRVDPLRRLRGRLSRADRHPRAARARAREGRRREAAGRRGGEPEAARTRVSLPRRLRAGAATRPRSSRSRSCATAGSAAFRPARCGPGAAAAIFPPCRSRRSESGGSPVSARDVCSSGCGRRSRAQSRRRSSRTYARRGLDAARGRRRGVRRARPRLPGDGRADERRSGRRGGGAGGRRARGGSAIPRDLDARLRPAGVELVEDDGLSPLELDGLDGALTTCAAACAVTGTIALDGGPGQGRRALTLLPDLHVCVVREDQIVETVPELVRRARAEPRLQGGRSCSSRARPRPPTSSWSASRASTARAGSS